MATMSQPAFTPNPVTALPVEGVVTFKVQPRRDAVATVVQYVLTSSFGLEYVKPASGLVRPEEKAASSPDFTASARTTVLVKDEYVLPADALTPITRGLGIRKVGATGAAMASIMVSVADKLASGELVGLDSLPVQIVFTKGL